MGAYNRVAPRDLFNEANLLKCLGRLAVLADSVFSLHVTVDDAKANGPRGWDIHQDDSDGSIWADAVSIRIGENVVMHRRPLNSRHPWPLYIYWQDEAVPVFRDGGVFSDAFRALLEKGL